RVILGQWKISERLRIFTELVDHSVAYDPYHLKQLGVAEEVDALATRIMLPPESTSQGFVDHSHGRGLILVEIGEGSPLLEGNAQRVEKSRRNVVKWRQGASIAGRLVLPFGKYGASEAAA